VAFPQWAAGSVEMAVGSMMKLLYRVTSALGLRYDQESGTPPASSADICGVFGWANAATGKVEREMHRNAADGFKGCLRSSVGATLAGDGSLRGDPNFKGDSAAAASEFLSGKSLSAVWRMS
jgi:hypothetical protein